MDLLKTIGNLIASFFWLIALGFTQLGNFFVQKEGG